MCIEKNARYDPLTIDLKSGATLLAGANMGGKTTALKTTGLLTTMVHYGIPVPAKKMTTCLFKGIFALYKDKEKDGLSGFGTEITRCRKAFLTDSLNIIDEFASSTNPAEGEALATALVAYSEETPSQVSLFVTHFSKPLSIVKNIYMTGYLAESEALENSDDLFKHIDHRLIKKENIEIPRGAFTVAKALGLSDTILNKARRFFSQENEEGVKNVRTNGWRSET
jgi:dsDNA-specific endonuclease/ATPase MutS2